MPCREILRQDLHDLIWSKPVVKVAVQFGVSDVAVAKACRKHKTPLPGRGYWSHIEAGQKLPRVTPRPSTTASSRPSSGGHQNESVRNSKSSVEIAEARKADRV